jgi:endonuclease/exonuclease/phosphatase family metal-dependent hydrolase
MSPIITQHAPRILLGAFFLLISCREEESTGQRQEVRDLPKKESTKIPTKTSEPSQQPATPSPSAAAPVSSEGVRFMAYNLKNYLTMDRYVKGGDNKPRPKDPAEVEALVKIIVSEKPDILGVCEIGTPEDLADLQSKLKAAGLNLPHTIHAGGADQTRHLAILSTLPIESNNSRRELPYQINGVERLMGRGLLHATIKLPGGPTHFVGLHLKSKREMKDFDQAEIRLNEARLAREHCEALMKEDPKARIVVYGDFNDTRKTPPLAMLMGTYDSETYLGDVFLKDSRGHLWTHFWSWQQQYARFDWVLVSPSVKPHVDMEHSYIVDPEIWNDASDHRATMVTFQQ